MKYIFGNWKMYLDVEESHALAQEIAGLNIPDQVEAAVFPNTLVFAQVQEVLKKSDISVGAQNLNWVPQGAYTGATSAHLFAQARAEYALVGHSERRHLFGENNDDVRKKLEACLDAEITPVLCVGETAEDLDDGKREYRLKKQLQKALEGLDLSGDREMLIAYEPVWAIAGSGEGRACSPEDCAEVFLWLKEEIRQYTDATIPLLYGGSVKPDTVLSYLSLEAVDGVLTGTASTEATSFTAMIEAAQR